MASDTKIVQQPPIPATTAGLLLAVGCALAAGMIAFRYSATVPRRQRSLRVVAAGGLMFQVVHVLEHLLQLTFWIVKPDTKPWLSAWAAGSADGLQYFCSLVPSTTAPASTGVEMLHLTGNVIFLGALTAWQVSLKSDGRSLPNLTRSERVQMFHVAEHLVLVGSLVLFGRATGLSTGFGLLGGSALVALRVWFHFIINAIATGFALRAAWNMRSQWSRPIEPSGATAQSDHQLERATVS